MGKARQGQDIEDDLRQIRINNSYLNGQSRNNSNRNNNVVTSKSAGDNNLALSDKFSLQGGMIKGSFSLFKTTTATLAATGIIDLLIYNSPRLVITNSPEYTLKVLNPVMGDGQFIYIRAVSGQTVPIQNTSGTGDLTTGNIETMAGTTYSLAGDDWIGFCYDSIDSKWHQFTAGKINVNSSGSEVLTWTANHNAAGFSLVGADDISFTAGSTYPTASAGMNSNSDGLEWTVSGTTRWYEWFENSILTMRKNDPDLNLYTANSFGVGLKLHTTATAAAGNRAGNIHFMAKDSAGTDLTWALIYSQTTGVSSSLKYSNMVFTLYDNNVGVDVFAFDTLNRIIPSRYGFRASTGTEISYQVDNSIIVIGSRGTVQIPTDTNTGVTITDDTALDSLFGETQGCCGVTGLRGTGTPIFWVRRADGSVPLWRGSYMTEAST